MHWCCVVVLSLDLGWWSDYLAVCAYLLGFEGFPKLLELHSVAFDVEGVVDDKKIFLIVAAGLVGPIEGAGHNKLAINDHEFVVHVVGRSIISSAVNTEVGHSLNVTSVGERALVISDNSNFDTISESSDHSVCEIVIGHSEDADQECLLCAGDVLANFFYVRLVWEEKGIHILGLSSH